MKLDKAYHEWVHTKSFIAWAKKNDTRKLVDTWYHYGTFHLFNIDSALGLKVKEYSIKDQKDIFTKDTDFSEYTAEAFHNFLV